MASHQALVAVRESGAEALDFAEEADFILRELAKILRSIRGSAAFREAEKSAGGNVHWFGDFRQRLERGRVHVFYRER